MRLPKFEVFKRPTGQWYWHYRAANGEIVAQSEGYSTRQAAPKGVRSVKRGALFAQVVTR